MRLEKHCRISEKLFGTDGKAYHQWIDQYSKYHGYAHRDILHHKEGVEIGVQVFGEVARPHLEQHVMDDLCVDQVPTIMEWRGSKGILAEIKDKTPIV